jgi:large subunit ribosomal protein L30
MSEKTIKITQVRSIIGGTKKQKATIKALGLGRPNYHVADRIIPVPEDR